MAAASPRKPRRTTGRHRKPVAARASMCARWLRVGAAGVGMAAAIAGGQGVASATPDDASAGSSPSASADDNSSGTSDTSGADSSSQAGAGTDNEPDSDADADSSPVTDSETESLTETVDADDGVTGEEDDVAGEESESEEPQSGPALDAGGEAAPTAQTASQGEDPGDDAESAAVSEQSVTPDESVTPPNDELPSAQTEDDAAPSVTPTSASQPEGAAALIDDSEATAAASTTQNAQVGTTSAAATGIVTDLLNWLGLGTGGAIPLPGGAVESLWLAIRQSRGPQAEQPVVVSPAAALWSGDSALKELLREAIQADFSRKYGWIPVVGTVAHAFSLMGNVGELGAAILRGDRADVADELRDVTRDVIGTVPIVGAPIAADLYFKEAGASVEDIFSVTARLATAQAMAPQSLTPEEEHALETLAQVLNQLAGWPEPPHNFVTPANYTLDQALDAHDDVLDLLFANPTPTTQWIPDAMALINLFVKSALPGYSFSDGLNTFGDLLNRLVPPYTIEPGPDYVMTKAQVAAASVGALVSILNELLGGNFDPESLRDAAIAGGTSGFLTPSSVLNMTFTTGAEPNPYSLMAYIALVGVYERFQWVALNHLPEVTGQTQNGQFLLSITGQVDATDPDGDPLTYSISQQPANGIVTVGLNGSWLYTRTSNWTHSGPDTFTMTIDDTLGQIGDLGLDHPYSPLGHSITVEVTVDYTGVANNQPTIIALPGLPDSMGIVRGSAPGNDIDGDTLTYSLVDPGTPGATSNSIYTSEGGIVALDTATGEFVYIPKVSTDLIPAFDTDSFQVQVFDGRGGTATTTVVVISNLKPGTSTTGTSAYVEHGKVDIPTADVGLLTYSVGSQGAKGTVVVNADGTYTYTRSLTATGSTSDTFTIIGTDANGKTVTLPAVSVAPPLISVTPTTTATGGTFTPRGMINGTAITPATQTTTGTMSGIDEDGNPVDISGGIYSTEKGGTVTITSGGGFLYTNTTYSDLFHKAAATDAPGSDKVDTVKITVTDSLGRTGEVTFSIVLRTENNGPSSDSSVGSADGLGVVRGSVSGDDSDGDSFTYSLAGVGNPAGATANSTYTANGGIVSLNWDGTFTYIPNKSAATTDSFKVLVSDGHGGTTTETVSVPSGTPSPLANVVTSTPNVVTGQLNIPPADNGLMTYSVGVGPSKGTVTVDPGGTFTYNRTSPGHSTTPPDSFTIIGTEVATGKTVTIATVNVTPVVPNAAPVGGAVAVTSSSLSTGLTRNQTATGAIGATDADGDPLTFTAGTIETTNGGEVVLAADGSFTYTISKLLTSSYYHEAAKIGASGSAVRDTFTVTVSDTFGASTSFVASVPIYATNTPPNTPTSGVFWGLGANDWTSVFATDPNGDSLTYTITKQPEHGSASYSSGSQILSTTGAQSGDTIILTVTDGYYVVVDGVVTGTPASSSRTYTV